MAGRMWFLQAHAVMSPTKLVNITIGELQIRSPGGASIVGIERKDANIINPGADEELPAGDPVLLLGNRSQIHAAVRLNGLVPQLRHHFRKNIAAVSRLQI